MISQRYLTTSPSEQLSSNTYTTLKTGAIEPRILSPEGLVESQRSPVLETGAITNFVAARYVKEASLNEVRS